jgi:hypothetical protein
MKPGVHVLDLLETIQRDERTIALIRHSKRDSFNGIPYHLRDTLGINPEGVRLAQDFGASIRQITPDIRLFLCHTFAKRCEMTAQSIRDGFSAEEQAMILGCEPEITSPVVNQDKLVKLRNEFEWQGLIQTWLNSNVPEDTLWNPQKYSNMILGKLLLYPNIRQGDVLVAVAHDMTFFPLVFSLFGKNVRAIEYLNGIVISANSDIAEIRFRNSEYSFRTELKIS